MSVPTNIFVFVPSYRGQVSGVTFDATIELVSTLMQKGIGAAVGRYSWFDIAELRNIMLSVWYDHMPEMTHLLFIDDDIGFPAALVTDMLAFGEPIVGGLYRKKSLDWDWAASALTPGTGEFRGRAFLEVEGLGCGAFLIRRDAVDRMVEKFPELIRDHMVLTDFRARGAKRTIGLFDPLMTPEGKVAEDISFCRRWRQTGGKVWAATGYEITHVGEHEFKGCYARWRMEQDIKRVEDQKLDGSSPAAAAG